jgi:hypothetical protein
MARRSFTNESWTPSAFLDTVSYTANTFMGLLGATATQRIDIWELFMGGAATVSSPMLMTLARDSTVAVGASALGTGVSDGPLDFATAALAAPPVSFTTVATTFPQRSATSGRLMLPYNANGGVVRWYAGDEHGVFRMLGNTAALGGEVSLSAYSGGTMGLMGSHMIYEPI